MILSSKTKDQEDNIIITEIVDKIIHKIEEEIPENSLSQHLAELSLNESKVDTKDTNPAPRASNTNENNFYCVKWIEFYKRKVPIILQNENGPCPLISICNVLLLRDQMSFPSNIELISNEKLIQTLADVLFSVFVPRIIKQRSEVEKQELDNDNFEQNINDALTMFEKLQYGLDVNVKFSGCSDFEYTREMDIFDLFSINLYHGWLIDPQDSELYKNLADKSYNQLVEISINGLDSKTTPDSDKSLINFLADDFLKSTASQLTYYGLSALYSTLNSKELAILFRNNHFSVVFKDPDNKCLYTLVTDNGYLNHPEIVWETLENIEGDGEYCNSNFVNINKAQNDSKKESNEYQNE